MRQAGAALALVVYGIVAVYLGWGSHLMILAVPFGVVSMLLAYCCPAPGEPDDPWESIIWPFASLTDLEAAWRSSKFRKTRYPRNLGERAIRSPFTEWLNNVVYHIIWLVTAPISLAFQACPWTLIRTRAVRS